MSERPWYKVASYATQKKREQLYREINEVKDERVRSNLEHTYYKLFSFLDNDLAPLVRLKGKQHD
jgi:hypothetical protein